MRQECLTIVQGWLAETKGWSKSLSVEGGWTAIDETGILELAKTCEWAEISDDSDLASLSPGMHSRGLIMGWGDLLEYCHSSGKSTDSKAYFLNAYQQS